MILMHASDPASIQSEHPVLIEIDGWIMTFPIASPDSPEAMLSTGIRFRPSSRPFDISDGPGEELWLFLPRTLFRRHSTAFDRAPAEIPYVGAASLLHQYLLMLETRWPSLSEREMAGVADATKLLVTACVLSSAHSPQRGKIAPGQSLVARARKLICENLHVANLGPDKLARDLGMSRSVLYRLFESHGGVASFILHERLDEAHRRLSTATRLPKIGVLAADLGFGDHSTFSRAFRRRFGYSPREAADRDC